MTVVGFARIGFAALALVWLWLAFAFPAGLVSIDEFFYVVGAEELLRSGSLIVDNGYDRHQSDDLRLRFFVAGPNGLTPQYPHGYMALAAPFAAAFGTGGFIVLNTLAALGTVALTWRLGRETLGDARGATLAAALLALATWLPDYAMGVWPHATATFFAMLAATLFYLAAGREDVRGLALLAGLAGGVALSMRADAVLAGAALTIWAAAFAARPVALLVWAALGALPPMLAMSAVNAFKFGEFFPLSYGSAGAQSVTGHLALVPLGIAGLAALAALRRPEVRAALAARRWPLALGALALIAAVLLLVPAAAALVRRAGAGLYVLGVDLQAFAAWERFPSITRDDWGYLNFFGLYKKAIGQSLPWLGLVPVALALLWRRQARPGIALCLIMLVVWIAPFAPRQWHGGLSNNMRYFTPALPFAAILGAAAWRQASDWAAAGGARQAPAVFAALALLVWSWRSGAEAGIPALLYTQLSLSKHLFLGLGAVSLALLVLPPARAWLAQAARLTALIGIAIAAFVSGFLDPATTYAIRQRSEAVAAANADLPGDSALYTYIFESFTGYFMRPDTLLLYPTKYGEPPDMGLIRTELAAGRRVFALGEMLRDQILAGDPGLRASGRLSEDPYAPRYEILSR